MKSLQDEATDIALRVGRAYLRQAEVPLGQQDDCLQEGVTAALRALPKWKPEACQLITHLYPWIRGAMAAARARSNNGGMGGRDARVQLVSLQDEVPELKDFDGEPLTYEDIVSYEEPPLGYGDPLDELLRAEEQEALPEYVVPELLRLLTEADRDLVMYYFGIDCQQQTQEDIAISMGISQATVSKKIIRIISKLRALAEG